MNKKILIFSLIIIAIIGGSWFFIDKKSSIELKNVPEMPEVDLSLSPIQDVKLPEIDLNIPIEFGEFKLTTQSNDFDVNMSLPENLDISFSDADFSGMNIGGTSGPTLNKSTCDKFKAAPSCSYIPAQYQNLCNQCKSAGY